MDVVKLRSCDEVDVDLRPPASPRRVDNSGFNSAAQTVAEGAEEVPGQFLPPVPPLGELRPHNLRRNLSDGRPNLSVNVLRDGQQVGLCVSDRGRDNFLIDDVKLCEFRRLFQCLRDTKLIESGLDAFSRRLRDVFLDPFPSLFIQLRKDAGDFPQPRLNERPGGVRQVNPFQLRENVRDRLLEVPDESFDVSLIRWRGRFSHYASPPASVSSGTSSDVSSSSSLLKILESTNPFAACSSSSMRFMISSACTSSTSSMILIAVLTSIVGLPPVLMFMISASSFSEAGKPSFHTIFG